MDDNEVKTDQVYDLKPNLSIDDYVFNSELDKDYFSSGQPFDSNSEKIHHDILSMILQYLEDNNYYLSTLVLSEEAGLKRSEASELSTELGKLQTFILDGDWNEVDKLCSQQLVSRDHHRSFLFAIYRHQFLELIDMHETQKAFTLLIKRLKPLESTCSPEEFRTLSYMLTARSVNEVPMFKNWQGRGKEREKLNLYLKHLAKLDSGEKDVHKADPLPPKRLLTLLQQAVQFQIKSSHPKSLPKPQSVKVETLLEDYTTDILPNSVQAILKGHTANVKAVQYVGYQNTVIASGSSDSTIKLWNLPEWEKEPMAIVPSIINPVASLSGHQSRVWDLSGDSSGQHLASASADRTIKVWDIRDTAQPSCLLTLSGHSHDVYSVNYHPFSDNLVVSCGYDRVVRLYDLNRPDLRQQELKGHQLAISRAVFNPNGNLIISGSKDNTVKFWDTMSGICVRTLSSHLGEVTSVSIDWTGQQLLTSSKDNSNRLWDVRMLARPLRRFKGHQNTSRHFIRSRFAGSNLIISGSEDGKVYVWDRHSGENVSRMPERIPLQHYTGSVYDAAFDHGLGTMVSANEDSNLYLWRYRPAI